MENHDHHHHGSTPTPDTAKDPVCGMNVSTEHPRGGTAEHNGVRYYFCGPKCRERFSADPEKYLGAKGAASPAPAAVPPPVVKQTPGQVYVCPMDPEVRES